MRGKRMIWLSLLILVVAFLAIRFSTEIPSETVVAEADSSRLVIRAEGPRVGLEEIRSATDRETAVRLAENRRDQMLELMERDPEIAITEAIGWKEYESLSDELKPYFEKPFNQRGDLQVLPICNAPGGGDHPPLRILEIDGMNFDAKVFGSRAGMGSKNNTPLSGITLGDQAVVAEFTFERLDEVDEIALESRPQRNPDKGRDFSNGAPLGDHPIVAIAGGERFLFSSEESLDFANRKLAEFDETPGPHGGAQVLFELADGDGSDGFDWNAAGEFVSNQASAWTENPKSVFFIRVDFTNLVGESTSYANLDNVLNTSVTDSIEEMSYGKTEINATVSASVVHLLKPTTDYLPNNNSLLHDDAIAAYEAIAGVGALSSYDIIGVHFASIGIQSSGGLTYAGLAGGSRQWLQGTTSSGVIIHEFGHNYGIGHASFWDTSDSSVVGAGSSVEYGDTFDIMGSGPDPEGHFHLQAKSKLNWLESTQWTDATAAGSGVYRIYRFDDDATSGANRGVRVTKASSPDEFYWIGYRPGIAGNAWLENGAYLLWQRPSSTRGWLLDTTVASTPGRDDAAIAIGATYSDATAEVHMTPIAKGGAGADTWLDVNVQIGTFPGNNAPTATLSAPGAVDARSTMSFSVSASDLDGDDLVYQWDFGDGGISENAALVSHRWAIGGSFTVKVTVSDMKGGLVTKSAVVVVSDPLDTWTENTMTVGRTMRDIEYLDGRFLVGSNKYISQSFDGVAWNESYVSLNYRSGGFSSDGDRFVAAGYDWDGSAWYGVVHYSDDGRIWQEASLPLVEELRDATFGNGVFVAVGDAGTILRSVDSGETWTDHSLPTLVGLDSVVFGDGVFVVVGDDEVYTSVDGMTWVDRSAGLNLASWKSLRDVAFKDGVFYAGGWYSDVHASSDGGQTWTATTVIGGGDYDIRSLAVGPGVFIATAERRSGTVAPVLLISDDGLVWRENPVSPLPLSYAMTYGNGVFSTVYGIDGELSQSDPLDIGNSAPLVSIIGPATADARDWLVFSGVFSDPDNDPLLLVWDFNDGTPLEEGPSVSHSFPVGGTYSVDLIATDTRGGVTVSTQVVVVSDPLDEWTERTSGTASTLQDITYGGGLLVAVGDGSGVYRTSSDGVTWGGGTVGSNIRLKGVVYDGSQFVAAGYQYDFGIPAWVGATFSSPNGSSWTRRHFLGEELRDVAYGGGTFVAVGDAGTVWSSADGLSWSPESSGTAIDLEGVSYGAGGFVAVGSDSGGGPVVVLSSADGENWTDRSTGAGTASWQGFYDVEFCNDRFLASGWFSKLRHSTDGGTSFSTSQSGTQQVAAFAYGSGIYLAAGIDKDSSDADINLISTDGETWSVLSTPNQANRQAAVFFNGTFISVGDGGAIWQSDAFSVPMLGGYAGWQELHFPGAPALSGPNDDYDGDGMKNLLEYKTGTDPKDGTDVVRMSYEVDGDQFEVSLPKDPAASDVSITVKFSTDLMIWSTMGTSVLEDSAELLRVGVSMTDLESGEGRGFLRAEVEQ